ncbi:hypothetical protein PMI06_004869 [Burkholderia sp. BT03]|nr:hypothetical protein PMI06_004869 [Burkholderia sp. BT03]SKC77788.1 hypothetical protein SAMN06266956_3146 [Paraburkholderia hospita]
MMPFWSPASVDVEPELSLLSWRVVQTERGERHFVGIRADTRHARVSSAIREFDANSMIGICVGRRRYRLIGPPGWTDDCAYLLMAWCLKYDVLSCCDVTSECYANPSPKAAQSTQRKDSARGA